MSDEAQFRRYLAETRAKADDLSGQPHVSHDIKSLLKDFKEISTKTEALLSDRQDTGADHRVLQKRYDALKTEHRQLQGRVEKLKELIATDVAPILKSFSSEATFMESLAEKYKDKTIQEGGTRIRMNLKRLLDVLTKI